MKIKELENIEKLKRNSVRNEQSRSTLPNLPFIPYTLERDHMGRLIGYNPERDSDVFRRRNYSVISNYKDNNQLNQSSLASQVDGR